MSIVSARLGFSHQWRPIGESVVVTVSAGRVVIRHGGRVVAEHDESAGRRQRIVDPDHFRGVAGHDGRVRPARLPEPPAELLRPLGEYEALLGGSW